MKKTFTDLKSRHFLQEIVNNFFSKHELNLISQIMTACYSNANKNIANGPLAGLRCPAGKKARPFVYYLEVEAKIAQLCTQGRLHCKAEWKQIPKNGDIYLVLRKNVLGYDVRVTINQTEYLTKVSRPAEYRKSLNHNTQLSLFDDKETVGSPTIYLELNHGYEGSIPKFIVLGLPTEDGTWIVKKVLSLALNTSTMKEDYTEFWNGKQTKSNISFTPEELVNNTSKKEEKNR